MAAETLPDTPLDVDRERWGFPLPLVTGQGAITRGPLAFDVQLDVVMSEDLGKPKQYPKLLEIDPGGVP
jgi:hypothetical protein